MISANEQARNRAEISAETSPPIGSEQLTIRSISEDDSAEILRLVERAEWVHLHADWTLATDWWESDGGLLAMRHGRIVGMVVASLDPAPVAWIRAIAIDMAEPAYALRKLLDAVVPRSRTSGADCLACMSVAAWVNEAMRDNQYDVASELESMTLTDFKLLDSTQGGFVIRDVSSAESTKLAELDRMTFDNPLWRLSARQLERAINDAYSCTMAEQDGQIIGYQLSLRSRRKEAHIVRMTVNPSWHGRGVASSLLTHTLNTFHTDSITTVTLNTQTDNTASQRLYKRFKFEPTGQRFNVWTKSL